MLLLSSKTTAIWNQLDNQLFNIKHAQRLKKHIPNSKSINILGKTLYYYKAKNEYQLFVLDPTEFRVLYFSAIKKSDDRGLFTGSTKPYYEEFVWRTMSSRALPPHFAQIVFLNIIIPSVSNVVITSPEQTISGQRYWMRLLAEAATDYNYIIAAFAITEDKTRYYCEISNPEYYIPYIWNQIFDYGVVFGSDDLFRKRGFAIMKKPISILFSNNTKVIKCTPEEFLKELKLYKNTPIHYMTLGHADFKDQNDADYFLDDFLNDYEA